MSQSQTSFLEEVVQWNSQQCLENLAVALPKLLQCLDLTEDFKEQVGILRIVCQSFLPCIEVIQAEEEVYSHVIPKLFRLRKDVYSHVIPKATVIYDLAEAELIEMLKMQGGDGNKKLEQVDSSLQVLMELLECCEACVSHAQKEEGRMVPLDHAHSLPQGTIHFLKKAYQHCKNSGELYGDYLTSVSEQLSSLFKKAHSLQVSFLHLLEKIELGPAISEQDVQDLCIICEGLFEVCTIVTSLDIKLVVTLWKTVSKQASLYKEHLKSRLNVGQMVSHLCSEIQTGYQYLFQLLPQIDSEGMVLSQGDEKGFQKSVKILGFQMKICTMLIREYSEYICDCETKIYELLINLHRSLSPSLNAKQIQQHHDAEIRRQLLNATETIMTSLLTNRVFMTALLSPDVVSRLEEDSFAHLILTLMAINALPKSPDDVLLRWLSPVTYQGDEPTEGVVRTLFHLMDKCTLEMEMPIHLSGPMCEGKPQSMLSLYQYVCVHLCAFVGGLSAKSFCDVEEILMENLLCDDCRRSLLASDVLCFISRYGSADLCLSHIVLLIEIMKELTVMSISHRNVSQLISRLVPFLSSQHQMDLLKRLSVSTCFWLWSSVRVGLLSSHLQKGVVTDLLAQGLDRLRQFSDKMEKTVQDFYTLNDILRCLINTTCSRTVVDEFLPISSLSPVLDVLCQLWASILVSDWLSTPLTQVSLGYLLQLTGNLIDKLTNTNLLKILSVINAVLKQNSISFLRLSIAFFLQQCGKVKIGPSFEQSQILNKLPDSFISAISDKEVLVHQASVHAFTQFAEETPHESVVTECIHRNQDIQQTVVNYLNKVPVNCPSNLSRQEYLTKQIKKSREKSQVMEVDVPVTGAQLQPSSKRPRIEEQSNDNHREVCPSFKDSTSSLLQILELCVSKLKETGELTADVKSHLKIAQLEIGNVLGETN